MRARSWMALGVTGMWILACGGGDAIDRTDASAGGDEADAAADAEVAAGDDAPSLEEGAIHVDYPKVSTPAENGQHVLVPSAQFLERAASTGNASFIYYLANVVETGEVASQVKALSGSQFSMPNSLILPLNPGYEAKVGDILLGHWEGGSGMRRAIVTGGSGSEPTVRYLEGPYDEAQASEQREGTFKPNRFHALTDAWQLGTSVVCTDGAKREHGILTHQEGDQVLVLFFAGRLDSRSKDTCTGLHPSPDLASGAAVEVPVSGRYTAGTVAKIDSKNGLVWVDYAWGGKDQHKAFSVVDVLPTGGGSAAKAPAAAPAPSAAPAPAARPSPSPSPRSPAPAPSQRSRSR